MSTSDLITLKRWELRHKLGSVTSELAAWKQLSEPKQPLEKHHRQVRRIADELGAMIDKVGTEIDALQAQPDVERFFQLLPRAEFFVLELHRTWDYFREKLLARRGPPFADLLESLDEFVWQCYLPMVRAYNDPPPEPPLVFLDGDRSPAASLRRAELALAPIAERARFNQLDGVRLREIVVPVISLPWYGTAFLPETLLLAHEAGHLVADDLGLNQSIANNLSNAGIDTDRLVHCWLPWASEVFADLYGVVCVGPLFVASLAALLARKPSEIAQVRDEGNRYPPSHLRLLLALAALKLLHFKAEAEQIAARWQAAYGQPALFAGQACAEDLDKVATALIDKPLAKLGPRGRAAKLKTYSGLVWNSAKQREAADFCARLLSTNRSLGYTDARVVLAGAALAFQEQPDLGIEAAATLQRRIIGQIISGREAGTRAPAARISPSVAELTAARTAGEDWYEKLRRRFETSPT
jgi:hypothetical protein